MNPLDQQKLMASAAILQRDLLQSMKTCLAIASQLQSSADSLRACVTQTDSLLSHYGMLVSACLPSAPTAPSSPTSGPVATPLTPDGKPTSDYVEHVLFPVRLHASDFTPSIPKRAKPARTGKRSIPQLSLAAISKLIFSIEQG